MKDRASERAWACLCVRGGFGCLALLLAVFAVWLLGSALLRMAVQ